jgi:ATP-dependent phosphofructokinase / diphosphate-dependent phosphofructokinase
VVVASEGLKGPDGKLLTVAQAHEVFAYTQLGGVAPLLARMIKEQTGHKIHWAVADYIQRAARHIASRLDVQQAYAAGAMAVRFAVEGHTRLHARDQAAVRRALPLDSGQGAA